MTFTIPLIVVIGILAWLLRPRKNPTQPRRLAILAVIIIITAVAIAAVIFQILYNTAGNIGVSDVSNTIFLVGLGLISVMILVSIGFTITRKSEAAKGVGFGICIAIIISIIDFGLLELLGGV